MAVPSLPSSTGGLQGGRGPAWGSDLASRSSPGSQNPALRLLNCRPEKLSVQLRGTKLTGERAGVRTLPP